MADPNWPAGLPYRLMRDDFQGSSPDNDPMSTPMEGGNIRMRPVGSVPVATIQGSVYWTDEQFEQFKTFWRTTLRRGTVEFNMPIFITSSYVTKKVQLVGATYKWVRYGVGWRITLALRVWDM